MYSGRTVKVTVTVEVFDASGQVELKVIKTRHEGCGNPQWTTRVAHRLTESLADTQRKLLGAEYGELDPKWKDTPEPMPDNKPKRWRIWDGFDASFLRELFIDEQSAINRCSILNGVDGARFEVREVKE